MRFIFLTLGYTPDIDGGGYRYATEVAERLATRGHEVHAVYPNPGNQFPAQEQRAGVELHRVPKSAGGFFVNWHSAHRETRRILRTLLTATTEPTLLFSHHAYLAPALRRLPFVMILQGPWALEFRYAVQARARGVWRRVVDAAAGQVMHRVERRALAAAKLVFVASEYSRSQLATWHPGLDPAVEVIGGGADFHRFQPLLDRLGIRRERGLSTRDTLFLAVRRLDPRMGLVQLVDAFARVASRFPGARLWLAGKGAQKDELDARIAATGMRTQAKLLGFVTEEELPRLYAAADAVLMPSLDLEGFGLATAEALACGTPVLASRAGANTELVAPLGERLLFEPSNVDSLAATLAGVLDGSLVLPPRERCVAYARQTFCWDQPCDAIVRAHSRFAVSGWPQAVP